jgi:hypothetical protein
MSVHREYNSTLQPTWCNGSWFLYFFSSISSTITSSSRIVWQYLKLYVQLCALEDGRRNRLKHVERL